MAAAVSRSMALGQNIHNILPSNYILVPPQKHQIQQPQQSQQLYHGKRLIAPAPQPLMVSSAALPQGLKSLAGKTSAKKFAYCGLPYAATPQQTASVQRRNARERNRVKQVNNGFANLRQHIPSQVVTALSNGGRGQSKKLSKVDTLKIAVEYIRSMQRMLDENSENTSQKSLSQLSSSNSSYYGTMSESSSPAPSHISEASAYTQVGGTTFKHEPYDSYIDPANSPAPSYAPDSPVHQQQQTVLPGMTTLSPVGKYSYIQHHVVNSSSAMYKQELYRDSYDEEMSPQNPDDEELLDLISCWQQEQ